MNKKLLSDLPKCVQNFTSLAGRRSKEPSDKSVISIHILSILVHQDLLQYSPPPPYTCRSQSLLLHSRLQVFQLCRLIDFIMLAAFFFSLKPLLLRKSIIPSYIMQQSYSLYFPLISSNFSALTFE